MDMDKIIEKMRENRADRIRESQICTRGGYSSHDMKVLANGYSLAVKDLTDMIEEDEFKISEERVAQLVSEYRKMIGVKQTPPCTGSSVQKQSIVDKLKPTITKESVPASRVEFKVNGEMLFTADSMEDVYKKSPPTNEQLMDKINEIIDVINKYKER